MSEEGTAKTKECQGHVDGFFFFHDGVHHKHAPPGQTIIKEFYIKVLRRLRDAVRRKQAQLWASGDWRLCLNSAPTCLFFSSCAGFFGKTSHHPGLSVPQQPRFGSLLLRLFPKLKLPLKERRFVKVMVTQYTSLVNGVSLLTE